MLYSSACEYAIRALTYLALEGADPTQGRMCSVKQIAKQEKIPQPFLGKIFQTLVRVQIVRSAKGPYGGFALAHPAGEITLYEVRRTIDGVADLERCAVGLPHCSDENPCPHHPNWKLLRQEIKTYLQQTTLQDMAQAILESSSRSARGKDSAPGSGQQHGRVTKI
jgi:Rrf2 family protein